MRRIIYRLGHIFSQHLVLGYRDHKQSWTLDDGTKVQIQEGLGLTDKTDRMLEHSNVDQRPSNVSEAVFVRLEQEVAEISVRSSPKKQVCVPIEEVGEQREV